MAKKETTTAKKGDAFRVLYKKEKALSSVFLEANRGGIEANGFTIILEAEAREKNKRCNCEDYAVIEMITEGRSNCCKCYYYEMLYDGMPTQMRLEREEQEEKAYENHDELYCRELAYKYFARDWYRHKAEDAEKDVVSHLQKL